MELTMTDLHERFCNRIERSHGYFCNWLTRKMSGPIRRRFDAEDLLQEIMTKCPGKVPQLLQMNDDTFRKWVRKALHNRLNTHIRKNRGPNFRRDTVSLDGFELVDPHDGSEEQAIRLENSQFVRTRLNALNRTDRSVIIARCIEHHSIDVIAAMLGISPAACRQRLGRAKRRLRNLLA
jgi:RNA polymerase sigma factor (sigma-70 family)